MKLLVHLSCGRPHLPVPAVLSGQQAHGSDSDTGEPHVSSSHGSSTRTGMIVTFEGHVAALESEITKLKLEASCLLKGFEVSVLPARTRNVAASVLPRLLNATRTLQHWSQMLVVHVSPWILDSV